MPSAGKSALPILATHRRRAGARRSAPFLLQTLKPEAARELAFEVAAAAFDVLRCVGTDTEPCRNASALSAPIFTEASRIARAASKGSFLTSFWISRSCSVRSFSARRFFRSARGASSASIAYRSRSILGFTASSICNWKNPESTLDSSRIQETPWTFNERNYFIHHGEGK